MVDRMSKKLTNEEFIKKAREIHGDKYDYSKVEYKDTKTKVCIICPEHGEFWQKPNDHLSRKYGCHKCGWIEEGRRAAKTTEEFISEAKAKYGDRFDYSKVNYINNATKVCIISHEKDCYGIEIGEFWQTPANHLIFGVNGNSMDLTTEKFIERARNIHGDYYDYSKVEYENPKTKVCIICPEHGEFWQLPYTHLRGSGCPHCKNISILEKQIRTMLINKKIDFEEQKKFYWLDRKSLDFYLPELNIAIECQGRQHFIGSKLWEPKEKIQERDIDKYNACKEHNVSIIYVINKNYSNINELSIYQDNIFHIKNMSEKLDTLKKETEK